MNGCDNTSACSWVNHKCKTSLTGRKLGLLFVGLLLGTPIGIQAEWLDTHSNFVADSISRLYDENSEYDYSQLLTDYPSLRTCRQFQPSDTLLTMIWDVVRNNASPDLSTVRELEPSALGSIISSAT